MGTGVTAACNGQSVPCGSFAAPLYGENAADASVFTLNLAAGRGALLHCFCAVPEDWQTLALTWHPDFAAGRSAIFTVRRDADEAALGPVPTTPPPRSAAWWICNSIPKRAIAQIACNGSFFAANAVCRCDLFREKSGSETSADVSEPQIIIINFPLNMRKATRSAFKIVPLPEINRLPPALRRCCFAPAAPAP